MKKYRMDTPKGRVQFEYDTNGAAAAAKLAVTLGVDKKTPRWFAEWEGKRPIRGKAPEPSAEDKRTYANEMAGLNKRKRVREIGFPPERHGTVVEAGPEGSRVRWDNGDVRPVTNKYLIVLKPDGNDDEDVKTEWQRREERSYLMRKERNGK